jgi:hypothetical protein
MCIERERERERERQRERERERERQTDRQTEREREIRQVALLVCNVHRVVRVLLRLRIV